MNILNPLPHKLAEKNQNSPAIFPKIPELQPKVAEILLKINSLYFLNI